MNPIVIAMIKALTKSDWFRDIAKIFDTYLTLPSMTAGQMVMTLCGSIMTVSILGLFHSSVSDRLALCAAGTHGSDDPWRILTYGLIHGGYAHLAGNLITMHSFLMLMTQVMTFKACTVVFTLGVLIPGWVATRYKVACPYPKAVGASCGITALIACAAVIVPGGRMRLFFLLDMPLTVGVGVIVGLSCLFIWRGILPGVWHQGHILGIMTGLLVSSVMI